VPASEFGDSLIRLTGVKDERRGKFANKLGEPPCHPRLPPTSAVEYLQQVLQGRKEVGCDDSTHVCHAFSS